MPEILYVSLDTGLVYEDMPTVEYRCFSINDDLRHVEGQLLTHFEDHMVSFVMDAMSLIWNQERINP